MVIKGPHSALTDFIKEEGIDIKKLQKIQVKTSEKSEEKIIEIKKRKKIKKTIKSVEMLNKTDFYDFSNFLKVFDYKMIINDEYVKKFKFENKIDKKDDRKSLGENNKQKQHFRSKEDFLDEFCKYLGKNRMIDQNYFDFFVRNSDKKLIIYDCSHIKNFKIPSEIIHLELYFCGQMENTDFLNNCKNIEILKIIGGFRLKSVKIPPKVRILNLSYCSNLSDDIIEEINKLKFLEELYLNHCYKILNSKLKNSVKKLHLDETFVTENFFEEIKNFKKIEELSISKCPNLFSVDYEKESIKNIKKVFKFNQKNGILDMNMFKNLKSLNIEGISTIKKIKLNNNIQKLNLNYSYGIESLPNFKNLKFLSVSDLDLNKENLRKIIEYKNLEELDISWNRELDDDILELIVKNLNLSQITIFGCFGLTISSAYLVYMNDKKIKIVGHPFETNYLMNSGINH